MSVIAICDDSEAVINNLSSLIKGSAKETGRAIKNHKFTSDFDIIFLDIKMPYRNVLETAAKIRNRDWNVSIVFLTSLVQHALDRDKVGALNYIIKLITGEVIPISQAKKRDFMQSLAWYWGKRV